MIFEFVAGKTKYYTFASSFKNALESFKAEYVKLHEQGYKDFQAYPHKAKFREEGLNRMEKLKEVHQDSFYLDKIKGVATVGERNNI